MTRAAASTSRAVVSARVASAGLTSTAKRVAAGNSSRKSPNRLAANSAEKKLMPVALPPGRARLATRPSSHRVGGETEDDRSGRGCSLGRECRRRGSGAAITDTRRRTRSATNSGNRSYRLPADRIFDRDVLAQNVAAFTKALMELGQAGRPFGMTSRNPITGIAGCCACATSGQVAATLPSRVMNSRRLIPDMGL